MRTNIWFYTGLLLVIFTISCKEEGPKVTSDLLNFPKTASGMEDTDLPVMAFENPVYHFDTVAVGEKITHSFSFSNKGKSPLVISSVKPACGCTTLKDWPKDPIAPGEGGVITVEFNSNGFSGAIDKSVFVRANTVPVDNILKLTGVVRGVALEGQQDAPAIKMERTR